MVVARACDRLGWTLADQRCVVQGFGNVGGVAASELESLGAKVIAVSDVSGGLHSTGGLDVPALHAYVREHGSLGASGDRVFTGLAPGRYTLRMRARDAAGNAAREQRLAFHLGSEPPRVRRFVAQSLDLPPDLPA